MAINIQKEFGDLLELITDRIGQDSDSIKHFGVKGMKWGVRKDESGNGRKKTTPLVGLGPDKITRTTPSGETLTLTKDPPPGIIKFFSKFSQKHVDFYNNSAFLTVKDSSGKSVGEAQFDKRSKDELNIIWVGVDESARGRGYATQIMGAAKDFASQEGFKKMTLEVPGNSPDARHIYEKMGFKDMGATKGAGTGIWGGLTNMEYVFDEVEHGFSRSERLTMGAQFSDMAYEDYLAHYGVKGMKWGKRKAARQAQRNEPNSVRSTLKAVGGGGRPDGKRPAKATKEEIMSARSRQNERYNKVVGAESRYYSATTDRGRKLAAANYKKMENELINNDDIGIARQRTKGEKASQAAMLAIGTIAVASLIGQKK